MTVSLTANGPRDRCIVDKQVDPALCGVGLQRFLCGERVAEVNADGLAVNLCGSGGGGGGGGVGYHHGPTRTRATAVNDESDAQSMFERFSSSAALLLHSQ